MSKAIDNRSPKHDAHDWILTLWARVGFALSRVSGSERSEIKLKPLWKQFDDTHHWDPAAEEWIPNDLT